MSVGAPAGFSLRQTVLSHGWFELAPFRWDDRTATLWRGEILSDGSTHLLHIRMTPNRPSRLRIDLRTGPASPEQRHRLRERVRRMLNLDLDLAEFLEVCRREPRLRYVPRVGAGRFLSAGTVYEDVFKSICGTNIGWKQAVSAVNRLSGLGRSIPGADIRTFPEPETILRAGSELVSHISRLGYRVPYLLEWCRRVARGEATYRAAERGELGTEDLRRFFRSVAGVGRTTCRYLLMMRGIADEIPIDSSVFLYCRINRFHGRRPTERQIERLYERFGSWKAYAYWFEFLPWAREHWRMEGK